MNVWLLQVSAVIHVFHTPDSFQVLHNKLLFPSAAYLGKCNLNAYVNCTLIVFPYIFFTLGQSQSQWRVNKLSFKTVKKLLVVDIRKPGPIMCRHRKVLVREMLLNITVKDLDQDTRKEKAKNLNVMVDELNLLQMVTTTIPGKQKTCHKVWRRLEFQQHQQVHTYTWLGWETRFLKF